TSAELSMADRVPGATIARGKRIVVRQNVERGEVDLGAATEQPEVSAVNHVGTADAPPRLHSIRLLPVVAVVGDISELFGAHTVVAADHVQPVVHRNHVGRAVEELAVGCVPAVKVAIPGVHVVRVEVIDATLWQYGAGFHLSAGEIPAVAELRGTDVVSLVEAVAIDRAPERAVGRAPHVANNGG